MENEFNLYSRRSIKNLKISLIAQAINLITGVAKTFIFTIFISPGNFGLIALSSSITGIIQLLKDFGYGTYIIQQKQIAPGELTAINTRVVLLGLVAFVIACLVTYPIGLFYKQPELFWIIPIGGAQFIFNSFTIVPISMLRRNMEFNKVAKIDVGSNLASLLCGLILMVFMRNYWVLLFSGVSYLFFQLVMLGKFKELKYKLGNPFAAKLSKSSTHFGTRVTTFNVLTFISTNLDNFIIGKLFGQVTLGVYSKGYEFGVINIDKVKRPIQNVYFSDIANKDNTHRIHLFFQYLVFIMAFLLTIVGPLLIYTDFIVVKIFGSQWKQLMVMLPPFLLTSFLWIPMSFADQLLVVNADLKKYLGLGVAKNIVGSVSIIVASFWGAKAIAWSYLIYHTLFFFPFCYYSFASLKTERAQLNQMMRETIIVVTTAMAAVTIPWLLTYFHILNPQLSLLVFAGLCFLNYRVVWKQINFFEPLVFIQSLFNRKAVQKPKSKAHVPNKVEIMEAV